MQNLDDVKVALPQLEYGKGYVNTVRAALNRAPNVYKKPATHVSACPHDFQQRFEGATNYVAMGFRSLDHFANWKTAVGGCFTRYQRWLANEPARKPDYTDDWPKILGYVTDEAPKLGLTTTRGWMQFTAFIAAAREESLATTDINTEFAHRVCNRMSYEARKTFLRGLTVWNALVGSDIAQAALAGLLPASPSEPPPKQARKLAYIDWLPAEVSNSLRKDFARFVHVKRHGEDDGLNEDPLGFDPELRNLNFTDTSAKAYGYAVGWVYRTLIRSELIDANDIRQLNDLLTYRNIKSATRIFQEMRADEMSPLKSDAGSLHSYVAKVTQIAIEHCHVSPETKQHMEALRNHPTVRGKSVGKMSVARRRRVKAFANDMDMQTRLLESPEFLMRQCQTRLKKWNTMSQHARMQTLKLGTAAAALAILLYGKPLRETNLRELRVFCDERQTLILPPEFVGKARLDLPGEITKNGKPIEGEFDPEAMPILRFYYEVIRKKLIAEHPFGKHHAESDFFFNAPRVDHAVEKSVFNALIGEGLALCGLEMDTHEMRHAVAFFVLDEDPNAIEEVAELLDNQPDTARKFYAWIEERKAHQSARAKMQAAKSKRLRGRKRA